MVFETGQPSRRVASARQCTWMDDQHWWRESVRARAYAEHLLVLTVLTVENALSNCPLWSGRYTLGDYNSTNESWTSLVQEVTIEYGPNDNWMVGQFAGNRFMNIGWTVGGAFSC